MSMKERNAFAWSDARQGIVHAGFKLTVQEVVAEINGRGVINQPVATVIGFRSSGDRGPIVDWKPDVEVSIGDELYFCSSGVSDPNQLPTSMRITYAFGFDDVIESNCSYDDIGKAVEHAWYTLVQDKLKRPEGGSPRKMTIYQTVHFPNGTKPSETNPVLVVALPGWNGDCSDIHVGDSRPLTAGDVRDF